MKKTISVNISGTLFHVEEDGYEKLRQYLDSIRKYFSRFEGNSEIITDIENRIAEIFSEKLNEHRQVITLEDVDALILTMGNVHDFKATEEIEDESQSFEQEAETSGSNKTGKKLFRDERNKVIGGVCSGLAHYFALDPAWIRITLALLVYASFGGVIVGYIIAWIAIPGSTGLEDQPKVKKMYRDEKTGVIGGVAAGLAHFLGIDVAIIRIVLVALGFVGFGIVLYLILWIALPKATSLTERMTMSGEPVTLSNIEKRIKTEDTEKESKIAAPVRILGDFLQGIGRMIAGMLKVARIFIGILLLIVSAAVVLALVVAAGILLGVFGTNLVTEYAPGFPADAFQQTFSLTTILAACTVAIIPFVALVLIGISLVAGKVKFGKYTTLTLTTLFIIGLIVSGITIPGTILNFSSDGKFTDEQRFSIWKGIPVIEANDTGLDSYQVTSIRIHSHDSSDIRIVRRFESQGSSRRDAIRHAQGVTHQIAAKDSVITLDSNIAFKPGEPFRAQQLRIDIYVPAGKPFFLDQYWIERLPGVDYSGDLNNFEKLVADSTGIQCLTCPEVRPAGRAKSSFSGRRIQEDLRNFDAVDLSGAFEVEIISGPEFSVSASRGLNQDGELTDEFDIYVENGTLHIEDEDEIGFNWGRDHVLGLRITMPKLEDLHASGAGKIYIDGFDSDRLSIDLSGAVKANAGIRARLLETELSGASQLELIGRGEHLEADLSGASKLKASDYKVRTAEVQASGASSATVHVKDRLEGHSTLSGTIRNRGEANLED